jgi:hypothetical protein
MNCASRHCAARPTYWSCRCLAHALSLPHPTADHRAPLPPAPPVSPPHVSHPRSSPPLFAARSGQPPLSEQPGATVFVSCRSTTPTHLAPTPTLPPSLSAWPRPELPPLSLNLSPRALIGFTEPPAPLFPLFCTLVRAQAHCPCLRSSMTPTNPPWASKPPSQQRIRTGVPPFIPFR